MISFPTVSPVVVDATRQFLGACILENRHVDRLLAEGVTDAVFAEERHRAIFRAMAAIRNRGDAVDTVMLKHELDASGELELAGGALAIASLTDGVWSDSGADAWWRIIDDASRLQLYRRRVAALAELGENRRFEDILTDAQMLLAELNGLAVQERGESLREVAKRARLRSEARLRGEDLPGGNPLPSGLIEMDAKLKPFDVANEDYLVIEAALPSYGKSSRAMQVVGNLTLRHGKRVACFLLETSRVNYVEKMASQVSGVDLQRMPEAQQTRPLWVKRHFATIDRLESEILDRNLWLYERDLGIEEIVARSRHLHAMHGLDMIVVDYAQLVGTRAKKGNREQEVAHVARQLKLLGKTLNVTVYAMAQLDRRLEKEHRMPKKSDLRESAALEQDADRIIMHYRPDKDHRGNPQGEGQMVYEQWLCQVKNRNGPTGFTKLLFYWQCTAFRDLPNVALDGDGKVIYRKKGEYGEEAEMANG